jgi:hypothetical protein
MLGFVVMGTLIARGTSDSPILFTSAKENKVKGDWGNIEFKSSSVGATVIGTEYISGSILEYVTIEYAGKSMNHLRQ